MIKKQFPLDFQWQTEEPFLFCVHHMDYYPQGNGNYGPDSKFLKGRDIGQDFVSKDGFRMYHGDTVPGFPVHPHRGFETVTIVRKGYVDHADSMGAAGRYGEGDVQWMTAGKGVQHSEMFPLLRKDQENTVELFQIWLNLPKKSKMAEPHFTMFWQKNIPKIDLDDGRASITLIAGEFNGYKANSPPPESWASQAESHTAIWIIKMQKSSQIVLPKTVLDVTRTLYFFEGKGLSINKIQLPSKTGFVVESSQDLHLLSADTEVEILLLQSKPIGEPVVQYGPFVMNTREEITQTFREYEKSQFGGWKWPRHDMVHGDKIEKFAKYPDGHIEKPTN